MSNMDRGVFCAPVLFSSVSARIGDVILFLNKNMNVFIAMGVLYNGRTL